MEAKPNNLIEFGGLRLDPASKLLWYKGEPVPISLKEMELLCLLVANHGEVVSKEKILETIWHDAFVEESNLSRHVYLLRHTLKQAGEPDNLIQNIPKRGYRFTGEVREVGDRDKTITLEERSLTRTIIEFDDGGRTAASNRVRQLLRSRRGRAVMALSVAVLLFTGILVWRIALSETIRSPRDRHPIRSMAVLPPRMYDPVDESLRLRMTDALVTRLSGVEGLSIRSTAASRKFLSDERDAAEVGRLLMVDAVVEGTLQREGDRIRINCRAIWTATGETIWTDQFDGRADRLLALQDAIVNGLVKYLDSQNSPDARVAISQRSTENAEAYEHYLTARYVWQKRTHESLKQAVTLYERAIGLDHAFVDAHVGLADAHYLIYEYLYDPTPQRVETSRMYLNRAMQLDKMNAQAYVTLGLIQTSYERDWLAAGNSFQAALNLNPNSADANHRLALLLLRLRRFEEAEIAIRKAKESEPTSLAIIANLGLVLYSAGKEGEALNQLRSAIELEPGFHPAYWYLARTYWKMGDTRSAFANYAAALRLTGDDSLATRIENDIGKKGDDVILAYWIEEWSRNGSDKYSLAILSSHRKNIRETLSLLEAAVSERHPWASKAGADPEFRFLADEERFQKLLAELRL